MAAGGSPGEGEGNPAPSGSVAGEYARGNGAIVGVTGPKRRIPERLAASLDLSLYIVDMFSADDKLLRVSFGARLIPVI